MLPIGGFFIVLFIGWFFSPALVKAELTNEGTLKGKYLPVFRFLVRFVAPVAIALVFIYSMGIIK
jgi:NSS family neurotransmitter:Na+ symporter